MSDRQSLPLALASSRLSLAQLPNIFWVIFPGILTFRFAFEIAERLRYAAGLERGQVELGQARKVKST